MSILKNGDQAFQNTFSSCMHDQMLESNRDDVKLEAMRCVTVMTAKGKLSVPRTLFPHIVKNVSSKNPELKKLIYLYLTNFASQEPELALLPVASLQKSLKSPNPLVRSSALKVLTSMRLKILSAILVSSLRQSVNDLSPYVRKTVAHSIIKIYRLDPSLQPDLIEYIERLLNDKNSMVLSSAVATFEVVCPDKLDLVQKHYRRFCMILADCNEWGQTLMLNLLVRYVMNSCKRSVDGNTYTYNPSECDPRILLRAAKPLTHSNNSAVVMAVIKLYIEIASHNEVRSTIIKPLIRLLYSHREIQLIVLDMFEELTTLKDNSNIRVESSGDDEDEPKMVDEQEDLTKTTTEPESKPESPDPPHYEPETCDQTTTKNGYLPLDSSNGNTIDTAIPSANTEYDLTPRSGDDEEEKEQQQEDEEEEEKEEEEDDEEEESEEDDDDDEEESSSEEESEEDEESESEDDLPTDNQASIDKSIAANIKDKNELSQNSIDVGSNKDPNVYREVFRPYIKSFFVKHNDCTKVKLAKLKILTNLSSSVNVSIVLRELQAYISSHVDDKEFVSAAIQAIGRCAIIVKEVAHTCLTGLTTLLSNKNEHIVSEAIVVLRCQIINKKPIEAQLNGSKVSINTPVDDKENQKSSDVEAGNNIRETENDNHEKPSTESDEDDKIVSTVIKQVTRLLPTVTAPQARATILWILAEFCDKNKTAAKCTPDVLRLIAKTFCQEDNIVKLQSLTLVAKFLLFLDKESKAELHQKIHSLSNYLFSLAKYDINHDVRDRGRFLKKMLEKQETCSKVLKGSTLR